MLVRIVTFDDDFMAKLYVKQTELEWPLLLDVDRQLYRGYHMEVGSWWSILNPVSIAKYVGLLLRGQRLQKSGSDYRQLGGDILVDAAGIVRLHHVSQNPHDRPAVDELLAVIRGR